MTYENYLGFSREVLLEKMRQILPEKRLTHCLGVEKAARDLAKRIKHVISPKSPWIVPWPMRRLARSNT